MPDPIEAVGFWAVQEVPKLPEDWSTVPENGWGLLVAASLIAEGHSDRVARTRHLEPRIGEIEDAAGKRPFTLTAEDEASIAEDINQYLQDAGAPEVPDVVTYDWLIRPPSHLSASAFWSGATAQFFDPAVGNHPSTLYPVLRRWVRTLS
ncbi:DUF5956 family protein [Galactobacter valiniphilus]|uniref:DUF5956 family protein n=1 Tax=Galactobacter valiniphilus TaxID=2676122 RepID=UPI0037358913